MLLRVAHDLRRRVEAHRLAVEERACEHIRVMALQPARGIDQIGEACGMAFRKAVFAEALDLLETAFGEIALVAFRHHAFDHLALERADGADPAERRHRATQPVGLRRLEARRDDRDPHRLFLEQRHAQRFAEHLLELVGRPGRRRRRIGHEMRRLAPLQIGMNHLALDRAGPHDRDFDDEIVEFLRLQPRQHRHLRAAFDLEHADGIGALDHPIGRLVLILHREVARFIVMQAQEIEGAAQAAQHAEPQHVDLEQAERIEIVLVPFDDGAILHRRILDRHYFVEPRAGDDEAADMLRQMARKALQFLGQLKRHLQPRIGRIEAGAAHFLFGDAVRRPAPQRRGQRRHDILREPERLADFAHRAAAAIRDHGGGEARMFAAIFLVDVLDHLLAPLMLEIDVDIRRLAALGRHEALEQQIDGIGADIGDAEAIADDRIRRRTAALAQDRLFSRAREADDVMDGEEERRIAEFADHLQFVIERAPHLRCGPVREAACHAGLGQRDQPLLRRAVMGFMRIIVLHLVEREMAACEEGLRLRQRIRIQREQARHFLRRFQVAFGIEREQPPALVDGDVFADAGDDVLQHAAFRYMIEHVVDGDHRNETIMRDLGELAQPAGVVAAIEKTCRQPDRPPRCVLRQFSDQRRQPRCVDARRRHDDEIEALRPVEQVGQVEDTIALLGAPLAEREEPRQSSPGGTVRRIGEDIGRAIGEDEPRADRKLQLALLRHHMGAHHAGDRIAVGDADPGMAEQHRLIHQLFRMRGGPQEGEIGGDGEFRISGRRRYARFGSVQRVL